MKKRKDVLLGYILICIMSIFPMSLVAQETRDPGAGFASYILTFESIWSQETHPHPSGALHPQAHWSDLVGVTHKNQVSFLTMGSPVTIGVQNVAELGNSTVFFEEVQQAISENNAHNVLDFGALNTTAGSIEGEFEANPEFPFLTILSMIAPSPDWMIAANNIDLKDENGSWKEEIIIDLFPYDAGTDSGVDYTSYNLITSPVDIISSLQGITPFSTQKMGTLTITLNGVLGIQEQEAIPHLAIYPNPSNGIITINSSNAIDQKIIIYNTLGQSVYEIIISSNAQTIDLTHLNTGMYFIQSNSLEGIRSTQKLIIKY